MIIIVIDKIKYKYSKETKYFSFLYEYDLSFLGQIPLVQTIREGGDDGVPSMVGNDELTKEAFRQFTAQTVRNIAMRNANLPQTSLIEVV